MERTHNFAKNMYGMNQGIYWVQSDSSLAAIIFFTTFEKRLAPVFTDTWTQNRKCLQRSSKQPVHVVPSDHKMLALPLKASASNASMRQFVSTLYSLTTRIEAADVVAVDIQRVTRVAMPTNFNHYTLLDQVK
jgi:hypothetical protein